jgi:hypothetical protein
MVANLPLLHRDYIPEPIFKRVLLFNPSVYDTRFPWSTWQQPIALLQLATLLRQYQCDIRLVDALYLPPGASLLRRRERILFRDEIAINYWRFGDSPFELSRRLMALKKQGWQPDDVYIESFTTIWWEGVKEAATLVRNAFPRTRVIVYGAYPSFAPQEAQRESGADLLICGPLEGLAGLPLDLSLYPSRPYFTHLAIGTETRPTQDLIDEFLLNAAPTNVKERIRHYAFADHNVVHRFPEQFRGLLQTIIDKKITVSFYALGNLYPSDFIDDPELASLLFRSGFKQVVFADDRDVPLTEDAREIYLEQCRLAIKSCIDAGYKWRTESLSASLCIGRPGEDLREATSFMTRLAHVAGSLIVIPYQPSPMEYAGCYPETAASLELHNGKIFPFAAYNQVNYREYQDLLGLAAVFNAKYRSHSFDFLGDSLVSRLVQSSLIHESWDPQTMPSELHRRPVTVGWLNKEGKWVRS